MITQIKKKIHKNGRVSYWYDLNFTIPDGEGVQRVRRVKYGFKSPGVALKDAEKFYNGIDGGYVPVPPKASRPGRQKKEKGLTFQRVAEIVMQQIREEKKIGTVRQYESALRLYLLPVLGEKIFSEITQADLDAVDAATAHKQSGNTRKALSSIFSKAKRMRLECPSIDFDLMKKKTSGKREEYLTEEEISDLLARAKPDFQPVIRFFLFSGVRMGELLALEWEAIDVKNRIISISKNFDSDNKITTTPKSGKTRSIPLIDPLYHALKLQAALDGCEWKISGKVFPKWTRNIIRKYLLSLEKSKHLHAHLFRHTFISLMAQRGVTDTIIAEIVGHADTQTTRSYTHMNVESLRSAMATIPTF
jgi:integrase